MIGRIVGSVIGAYWDKADLDESAGSDILEFRRQPVPGASRRTDSPVAIAAVNRSTTDMFWIDTANRVATAIPRSPRPHWTFPTGRYSRPGINDEILSAHRTNDNWATPTSVTGGWPKPVTAMSSVARQGSWMEVFWLDVEGGVWGAQSTPDGVWGQPGRIFRPQSVRDGSPLVVVAMADDRVDLFWIARDGTVMTAWFTGTAVSIRANGAGWARPRNIDGRYAGRLVPGVPRHRAPHHQGGHRHRRGGPDPGPDSGVLRRPQRQQRLHPGGAPCPRSTLLGWYRFA